MFSPSLSPLKHPIVSLEKRIDILCQKILINKSELFKPKYFGIEGRVTHRTKAAVFGELRMRLKNQLSYQLNHWKIKILLMICIIHCIVFFSKKLKYNYFVENWEIYICHFCKFGKILYSKVSCWLVSWARRQMHIFRKTNMKAAF